MANDLTYVRGVLGLLAAHDLRVWLFGGWAEELHGVTAPRPHKDIDLLYPANDFRQVDGFLSGGTVDEIVAKRFPHKRAFELDGVMTELFLVQQDAAGRYTSFWDQHRTTGRRICSVRRRACRPHRWPRFAGSVRTHDRSPQSWTAGSSRPRSGPACAAVRRAELGPAHLRVGGATLRVLRPPT
jgi:hypothetical protein